MRFLSFALPSGLALNSSWRVFYSLAPSVLSIFIYSILQPGKFLLVGAGIGSSSALVPQAQSEHLPEGCRSRAPENEKPACLKLFSHQELSARACAPPLANRVSTWSPGESVSPAAAGISHVLLSFKGKESTLWWTSSACSGQLLSFRLLPRRARWTTHNCIMLQQSRAAPMYLIAVTVARKKGFPSAQLHKRSTSRALNPRHADRLLLLFFHCYRKTCCHFFLDTFSASPPALNKDERQQAEFITPNKPQSSLLCIHLWKSHRKLSLISFLSWIMVSKKELNSHKKNEAEAIHCFLISLYFLQNT